VVGLSQAVAREVMQQGIRVNVVCPGGIRTPMSDLTIATEAARDGVSPADKRAEHDRRWPRGTLADPEEVANVCVFLASDLASNVAASTIVVNGGQ
jgi:NAD(P)-dependent dehydrogenase (short-subunit alcohol dehydrogenase family)